ncbi:MAG: hypothetical protein ACRD3S_14485 [Terracidiphilus sp.]
MDSRPIAKNNLKAMPAQDDRVPAWINAIGLIVWLAAAVVAFLPFARNTSAWDAVTFRVPGNQGNWWHFLAGAPFFLAFPMVWLRLRLLFSGRALPGLAQRFILIASTLSVCGTLLMEAPFLLHLAGTSDWQRFAVLGLGLGIIVASVLILLLRRRRFAPAQACLAALDTAFLADLSMCLVIYAGAEGSSWSHLGWNISMVIVWPIACELLWLLSGSLGSLLVPPGAKP